jgi:hypothetical protein
VLDGGVALGIALGMLDGATHRNPPALIMFLTHRLSVRSMSYQMQAGTCSEISPKRE